MKVNLDLTAVAAENLISDELKNNVGAAAFNMVHDFFYGATEMEIWTAAGQTGTQLTEGVDYTLGGIDSNFSSRAGRSVYTTVVIDNVTYQTGDLYFTYQATADYVDADDRYSVVRAAGQSWELTAGGAFELYTTDATADSILLDSAGGLDINTVSGWEIADTGGGYFWTSSGQVLLSTTDALVTVQSTGTGGADFRTTGTGNVRVYTNAANTNVAALQLTTPGGGIDVDSVLGIHIKDLYGDTGTGNGITLLSDNNNAAGTGGNITVQTAATSGTSGNILINSAGTGAAAINIDSAGGIDLDTAGTIDIDTSGGYIDVNGNGGVYLTSPAGNYIFVEGPTTGYIEIISEDYVDITAQANVDITSGNNAADRIKLDAKGTGTGAAGTLQLIATLGDIYQWTRRGIILLTDYNVAAGTGDGITLTSEVNEATATGGNITIETTATLGTPGNIAIGSAANLTFDDQWTSSPIGLSETGEATLDTTSQTIVGAINELVGTPGGSLDDAYNGGSSVTVDTTDVDWNLSASRDFRIYDATDADKFVVTNGSGASSIKIDTTGGVDIDSVDGITIDHTSADATTGAGVIIKSTTNSAIAAQPEIRLWSTSTVAALGADIQLLTQAGSGTSGDIVINSGGLIDVDAVGQILITTTSTSTSAFNLNATAGGFQMFVNKGIAMYDTPASGVNGTGITISARANGNGAAGDGGDLLLTTVDAGAGGGTIGRVATISNSPDADGIYLFSAGGMQVYAQTLETVFYGTNSTTGALPVITLDQADTDEPFIKFVGDAASADLTRNIIDTADVTTPTIVGYIKIEILDDGNQVTDGDYFVPFYSLA